LLLKNNSALILQRYNKNETVLIYKLLLLPELTLARLEDLTDAG
jgi:hypothetical protein